MKELRPVYTVTAGTPGADITGAAAAALAATAIALRNDTVYASRAQVSAVQLYE